MAESSGPSTPQLRKLGIVPGARWALVGADPGWTFETAPDAASEVSGSAPADVVLVFVRAAAELDAALDHDWSALKLVWRTEYR